MYVILVYDISSETKGAKVLNRVFKICKRYLHHIQYSVFEGELTEAELVKMRYELKSETRDGIDSIIIFKSRHERWLEKEFIGKTDDCTSNFL